MTDLFLSPAAQAVLDAFLADWADSPLGQDRQCLAAALRAVADQLGEELEFYNQSMVSVEDLLAIAAELETPATKNQ
jgi:hypothetical protein